MPDNEQSSSDLQFEKFSELLPERSDIELPKDELTVDEGEGGGGTLSQRMKVSPKLSDVQTIDKRLFPNLGCDHLNNLMIAGIFPDLYNDLFDINVKGLLIENPDMSLEEAVNTVETALSVGIDREGRIDAIAILGSPQAGAESDKNKGLGGL